MAAPHQALLPLIRGEEIPRGVRITTEVISSAEEHGVAALLDYQVERRGIDLGQELRTRLALSTMSLVAENQAAQAAAETVTATAGELNVDIAIFKGIAIGQQFYADPQLRPTIDIDVSVNPAHTSRMGDLVAALGADNDKPAIDAMVTEGRVFEHSIPLQGTVLDLHRDPMNMILVSRLEQQRWDDAVVFQLASGEPVRTLDLEWAIIQALVHAFRDNFADLLHIYDLDLMFDDDPDWERIAQIAHLEGWTDTVRFATAFVCDVLDRDTPLPRKIQRSNMLLINRVWPRDKLLKGKDSVVTSHRRQLVLSVLTRGRTRDLTTGYARRIVPPRNVIDTRMPQPSDDPYAVALYKWRRGQRNTNIARKASIATTNGAPNEEI